MEFSDIQYNPLFLSERFIEGSGMTARLAVRSIYRPTGFADMLGVNVKGLIESDNKGNDITLDVNTNYNE